ncbi:hypothetical protein BRADI_4g36962v3 [Brachypodium distachyon]|uniref:Uncharacterized protein n=1 Tax=Brachypodium distachyon TaxID=15368 RepID=A0A2K2CSQ2_BRADI|nr:hypothetical protein BRADI_4g36962v3 [Brachypodium distachyon]
MLCCGAGREEETLRVELPDARPPLRSDRGFQGGSIPVKFAADGSCRCCSHCRSCSHGLIPFASALTCRHRDCLPLERLLLLMRSRGYCFGASS